MGIAHIRPVQGRFAAVKDGVDVMPIFNKAAMGVPNLGGCVHRSWSHWGVIHRWPVGGCAP